MMSEDKPGPLTKSPHLLKQELEYRRNRLQWREEQMAKHGKEILEHLKQIREERLWADEYQSFEEYCEKRWSLSLRRVNQMLAGEATRILLMDAAQGDTLATAIVERMNEGQSREVAQLPPAEAIVVLKEIAKTGKVTAKRIREKNAGGSIQKRTACSPEKPVYIEMAEVVEGDFTTVPKPEPALCPECGQPIKS